MFPPRPHSELADDEHGLIEQDAWVTSATFEAIAWKQIDLGQALLDPERRRLARIAFQIAEDIASLAEIEGEKRIWRRKIAAADSNQSGEPARSLKFLVDGELSIVVSLAHLVVNLTFRTLAQHPRWHVTDVEAVDLPDVAKSFRTNHQREPELGNWPSAGSSSSRAAEKMATTIGDPRFTSLAQAFGDLAKEEQWWNAIIVRGDRHHKDGRGTPPGVQGIPDTELRGMSYGTEITFLGKGGAIDYHEEAASRLADADLVASTAVESISLGIGAFRESWVAALKDLNQPELEPWATPPNTPPPDSGNGRRFPYLVAIDMVGEEGAQVADALLLEHDIQKLWSREHPTTYVLKIWDTSYAEAEAKALSILTDRFQFEPSRIGPARSW